MPRRDGQRQQHFVLDQRQYRKFFRRIHGIRTVIFQVVFRPRLPAGNQAQATLDIERKLHATKAALATQHRFA